MTTAWSDFIGQITIRISGISTTDDGLKSYRIVISSKQSGIDSEITRTSNDMKIFHDTLLDIVKRDERDTQITVPHLTGYENEDEMLRYWHWVLDYVSGGGRSNAMESLLIFVDDYMKENNSFYCVNKSYAMNELLKCHSEAIADLSVGSTEDHNTLKVTTAAIEDLNMRLGHLEDGSPQALSRRGSKYFDIGAFVSDPSQKNFLPDSRRNSYRSEGSVTDTETKNSDTFDEGTDKNSVYRKKSFNSASSDSDVHPFVIYEDDAYNAADKRKPSSPKSGFASSEMSFDSWVGVKKEMRTDAGLYGQECLVAPALKPYEHSELLPPSLIPRNSEKQVQDELLDNILALVKSSKNQIQYRNIIYKYFSQQIRKILCSRADVADLSAVNCNLPDDPIVISICMKNELVAKWHTIMLPIFRKSIGTNNFSHSKGDFGPAGGSPVHQGMSGSPLSSGLYGNNFNTPGLRHYATQGNSSGSSSSSSEVHSSHFRPSWMSSGDSGTDSDAPMELRHAKFSITYATAQTINVVEGLTPPDKDGASFGLVGGRNAGMDLSTFGGSQGNLPENAYFSKVVGSAPGVVVPDEGSSPKEESYIQCGVDNIAVAVSANKIMGIAMAAMVEQVNLLVGKDNLFKNSLVLIRAWWAYETASYVGSNIRHYLGNDVLCVMTISIFNRYHTLLHQPLQALAIFLSEYAEMDWTNQAITLQGVVPFRSKSSATLCPPASHNVAEPDWQPSYPWLINPSKGHLLTPHLIKVFWGLVNVKEIHNPEPPTPLESAPASVGGPPAQPPVGLGGGSGVSNTDSKGPMSASSPSSPQSFDIEEEGEKAFASILPSDHPEALIRRFERSHINIVSPLNHCNLFLAKGGGSSSPLVQSQREVDHRRAFRRKLYLEKVFTAGAKKLAMALRLHEPRTMGYALNSNLTLLSHFFSATCVRYSLGTRPDMSPSVLPDDSDDFEVGSFDLGNVVKVHEDYNRNRTESDPPSVASETSSSAYNSGSAPSSPRASFILHGASGSTQKGQCSTLFELWSHVQYHNLLVKRHLSGSSLVMIVDEVLETRGALPVGEIGKMLQDLKITSLSTKLKETFGGLKKFLETHSHRYILGDDHQFNPHVMLVKDVIAAGELENAKQGINTEFVSRFKRLRPKRRGSNSSLNHPEMGVPSAGRLAMANAMDSYVGRTPSTSTAINSTTSRGWMREMPPPQGLYGTQDQFLDPSISYGVNSGNARQHAQVSGQTTRLPTMTSQGPPAQFQGQVSGGNRGQLGGSTHVEAGYPHEEMLSGLSMNSRGSGNLAGVARSSTQNYYQQQQQQQQQQHQQHQQHQQQQQQQQQHLSYTTSHEGLSQSPQLDHYQQQQFSSFGGISSSVAQESVLGGRGLYNQSVHMTQGGFSLEDPNSNRPLDSNTHRVPNGGLDDFSWADS